MGYKRALNIRDLGGIPLMDGTGTVPRGLFFRSGKLSILTKQQCRDLCHRLNIRCVIDLRTPVEAAEFPDPLPEGVEYRQLSILQDATVGITHETGSDPMTIIRNLRRHPERLQQMVPDFSALYRQMVTDPYSRRQLDSAVALLRKNAEEGITTLFHCTAGKDRTGVVSMALLKSYGVSDDEIVRDYLRTNRSAWPSTMKKCIGIFLMTRHWRLVKTCYKAFMADKRHIGIAIDGYDHE